MKRIETLIEKAKGNKIALIVPEELIDTVEKYFDDDNLYDFTRGRGNLSIFGIDFDNDEKVLDCGLYPFYVAQEYELITLTKEDFKDVEESSNQSSPHDDRTLLIVYDTSHLIINIQTGDIYFNQEEAESFFMTSDNPSEYTVIPAFGKSFERTPHISIY